jgi:hypothetical protein
MMGPIDVRDTLDTSTTSKTSDRRLCDTLDVVTKNLAMSLGSTLAEALATLSTCEMSVNVHEGVDVVLRCALIGRRWTKSNTITKVAMRP